jgi:hypothetical protein
MKKNVFDQRELLIEKLIRVGIDFQKSFFISIDAGINLVDKEYLIDFGLRGKQLKTAERIVEEFYWGNLVHD